MRRMKRLSFLSILMGFVAMNVLYAFPQIIVDKPEPSSSIDEIEKQTAENLQSRNKNQFMMELSDRLGQNLEESEKIRTALCLVELMLNSHGGLSKAEELLASIAAPVEKMDGEIKAKFNYCMGLANYSRSQLKTRTSENLKTYFREKEGLGMQDPFLDQAVIYFEESAKYFESEWGKKGAQAVNGLANRYSNDAFRFNFEMAMMFDEYAAGDVGVSSDHYERVITAFERGESGARVEDDSLSVEERIQLITDLSRAYFKVARFDDALGVNEMGINFYGEDPEGRSLHFNRAFIFKYLNRLEEAEQEYKKILKQYSMEAEEEEKTQLKLSQMLIQQGKNQEALPILQKLRDSAVMPGYRTIADRMIGHIANQTQVENQ